MADAKDFGRGRADPSLESSPSVGVMEDEIAKEILAIQLDSYGRAAATARAHVLDDLVVVLLDGLQLQPNEEFMITQGQASTVRTMRTEFQQAIASSFKAVVERSTGRRVVGFVSQQQVTEPRFAVEIFRLAAV